MSVKYSLNRGISVTLLLAMIICPKLYAQTTGAENTVSDLELEQVLDLVFPRDVLETVGTYSFVLRYEPSFGEETQITMVERGGKTEVVRYVSKNGNIEQQLNAIRKRFPRASPQTMARNIIVTKQELLLPREDGTKWLSDFYSSACLTFEDDKLFYSGQPTTVVMDGTRYQLWYHGLRRVHYDLGGTGVNSAKGPNEEPLITWIKKIYHQVKDLQGSRGATKERK